MKNQLSKILVLSLALQTIGSAQAASIEQYRACAKSTSSPKIAQSRMNELRALLGSNDQAAPKIDWKLLSDHKRRLNYSAYLKSILQPGATELYEKLRYGNPDPVDPSMTLDQYRQYQAMIRQLHLMRALNSESVKAKEVKNGKTVVLTGISAIVKEFFAYVVSHQKKELNPDQIAKTTKDEITVRTQVEKYLAAGPKDSKGNSPLDYLGDVHNIEVRNGKVDEIHFTHFLDRSVHSDLVPGSKKLSLQLNMLLTFRTGQDDVYLMTQKILHQYFEAQRRVFAKRLVQLKSGLLDPGAESPWQKFKKEFWDRKVPHAKVVDYYKGDVQAASDSIRQALTSTADEYPEQVFKNHLTMFLEGKVKPGEAGEKDFIEERMRRLDSVIPYLKDRVAGSEYAHKTLGHLTQAQLKYVLDFFIQIKGSDVLTETESASLGEFLGNNAACVGETDLALDQPYYRTTDRLLTDLKQALIEEKANRIAKAKDLAELRKIAANRRK
ncbi:MAG: hypothetical protein JNL01_00595 [Bdellovibrionales bacterium]|nr:hypothetical protein [Bdellovibrionales bacterium]